MHPREEVGATVKTASKSLEERGREICGRERGGAPKRASSLGEGVGESMALEGRVGRIPIWYPNPVPSWPRNQYQESRKESNKRKSQLVDVEASAEAIQQSG